MSAARMSREESKRLLDVVVDDARAVDATAEPPSRTSRSLRHTERILASSAAIVLFAVFGFLFAHDALRHDGRLGGANVSSRLLSSPERGDGSTNARVERTSQLGDARVLTPTQRLVSQLRLVPGTNNEPRAEEETVSVTRSSDGRVVRVPRFLERWGTAPYWGQGNSYIPVVETPNSKDGKMFVVGHATNLQKHASHWLASATHWGLPARLSGNGTERNNWEDKTMGLKTNLQHMEGDPVVVASDTGDVFFTCGQDEFMRRFEESGADIIASGETQLYPEVKKYFDMTDLIEWQHGNHLRDIGQVQPPTAVGDAARRYRWANAGLIMGRKSALMRYIDFVETHLFENNLPSEDARFRYACTPYGHSQKEAAELGIAAKFFDDQLCLNSFAMHRAASRDLKFKIDSDGAILHSPGGIKMDDVLRDSATGRIYNKETGKSPCAWHFNNPIAKRDLKLVVHKFPNYFISEAAGAELLQDATS